MMLLMGSLGLILTIAMIVGAPVITMIILGSEYQSSIAVIQILAFWIFINAVTNVWGIQIMLPLKYDKAFFMILLLAGLMNIVLAILLVPIWSERGMALSVLLSCIFVTVAQPTFLRLKGINVIKIKGG